MIVEKRTFIVGAIGLVAIVLGIVCNSLLMFWCVAALLFLLCLYSGRKENRILNPYYLFAITPFTLLIYKNISDNYMQDLEPKTWLIALLNIAAFVFSMLIMPKARENITSEKRGLETNSIEFHACILAVLGIGPMILFAVFGVATPFYSIFGLLSIPALCCAIVSENKKLLVCLMLLNIATWISNVSKSTILTTCLCFIICYEFYFIKSRREKKKLLCLCLIGLIIILLAFTFANQARGAKTAEGQLSYYVKYGNVKWNGLTTLFMPYMYLETPWTNLQYVMNTQDTRTYGLWLIKPILNYLQLDGNFENLYQLTPMSSFNTYSFIACNFKDFGFWGSMFSSILLGCYVKWVYSRACQTKNPLDVACYVYVAQAVLEMFFSNHFFQQAYPLTCVILIGLYKTIFCTIKRRGERRAVS